MRSNIADSEVTSSAPSASNLLNAVVLSNLRTLDIPSVIRKTVYPRLNKSRAVY